MPIFNLDSLMHVPNITKNLISVSKFAHDNNVFFEFYSNALCQVLGIQRVKANV